MRVKKPGRLLILLLFAVPTVSWAAGGDTDPATGMEFVVVKGGCYAMGDSVGDGDPNERPVHEVCVSDFSIGEYEVTNGQFRQFDPQHTSNRIESDQLNDDRQPVVNVSWEQATAYAKWLSEKSGATYRLPTEAEWEYAARAGVMASRFWGSNPDEACQYANVADLTAKQHWAKWTTFSCDDKYSQSAPVGSFMPNGNGIYDMLGNVWEWCEDVYNSEAYAKLPKDNPVFTGMGEYRVMRGGGWSNGPLGVRSSHRVGLSPDFGHHALGFRLVKAGK